MNRRDFTQSALIAGMGVAAAPSIFAQTGSVAPHQFNLKYAPHLGMFKHSAGDDPIDQLNFMADQGFTAFEDNNMNTRPVAMQEKMAARPLTLDTLKGKVDLKWFGHAGFKV